MARIGIGIVGGGYMGKAHSAAFAAVGTVFETRLKPRLVSIAGASSESGARYAEAYGFERGARDWRAMVDDPEVEAVVIASPQSTHLEIATAAFEAGKPVLCEKPMGLDAAEARAMLAAAERAGVVHSVAYNYSRTPATQFARKLIGEGALGRVHHLRIEHTEDFHLTSILPPWRSQGEANGCLGDLAPHPINAALALGGPIAQVFAVIETVFPERNGVTVTNDDQVLMTLRFASGATGHLFASRVATGKKMGYAYEVTGEKGAVRFDQEDQNALWVCDGEAPAERAGFTKVLTGPAHPDYKPFCLGPGHGTGYQDQIIIEAKDFLTAIDSCAPVWPTFADGVEVHRVIAAARASAASGGWARVSNF
ncbi:1,5-anhydro-D-fructose reductase [Antarctobacter heliothermus]|uniref:1,5-anhydro-D-fructose reductase n=1 Tax=Antarctobacter heliothermus TaxID=74033 RepID=A0A222E4A8_9RHOB|nr:Gfo/Idh/MocA family oxidoreductase [Antarctobacter heliothermus]ASP21035.1 1,5-anhydro-D-fructose reductase [Antarctobacter heliothermus]